MTTLMRWKWWIVAGERPSSQSFFGIGWNFTHSVLQICSAQYSSNDTNKHGGEMTNETRRRLLSEITLLAARSLTTSSCWSSSSQATCRLLLPEWITLQTLRRRASWKGGRDATRRRKAHLDFSAISCCGPSHDSLSALHQRFLCSQAFDDSTWGIVIPFHDTSTMTIWTPTFEQWLFTKKSIHHEQIEHRITEQFKNSTYSQLTKCCLNIKILNKNTIELLVNWPTVSRTI